MKLRCSRCGKDMDNIAVRIENSITVMQINQSGIVTPYSNFQEPTSEIVCLDCFDKYCECLNTLNDEANVFNIVNMVDIVDDIQYDDEDDCSCEEELQENVDDSTN